MSIQRVKACAGVALEKGLGAEGRGAQTRSWHCGKYPLCCRRNAESYPNPVIAPPLGGFCGQGYALWRTPAFQIEKTEHRKDTQTL